MIKSDGVYTKLIALASVTHQHGRYWDILYYVPGYEVIAYASPVGQYTTEDTRHATDTLLEMLKYLDGY